MRYFYTINLKRIVLSFISLLLILFITAFSLIFFGKNKSEAYIIPGYKIQDKDITFNEKNGGPKVKLYIQAKNQVVEMYLEEYVRGVVAAEMPASFEMEALKAQAVAARTYAVAHMEEFGGRSCVNAHGGNLCSEVHCQAYIDKDSRFNAWPKGQGESYWNKLTEAVLQTSGQVLTYNDKLVMEPFYFAVSSGKTYNSQEVFSSAVPYLVSVDSPGEEKAEKFINTTKLSYKDFIAKINATYPLAKLTNSNVKKAIKITPWPTGTVKEVKAGNAVMSGPDFRKLFGLYSANFTVKFNSTNVEITSKGYGHGVGMSQWGAGVMAKQGSSYTQILTHYYKGTKVDKIEVLFKK